MFEYKGIIGKGLLHACVSSCKNIILLRFFSLICLATVKVVWFRAQFEKRKTCTSFSKRIKIDVFEEPSVGCTRKIVREIVREKILFNSQSPN